MYKRQVDKRFAAEMITSKGRAHKFDDVLCMKQYADYYTEQSLSLIHILMPFRLVTFGLVALAVVRIAACERTVDRVIICLLYTSRCV